jgi:hypothetical protein
MFALTMRGQWEALCSSHWLRMGGGAKRVRPDHEGAMGSALLGSLAAHGHRRTYSAAPWDNGKCFARVIGCAWAEGRNVFALPMRGQWEALRSGHWLSMDIGGHVPPLHEDNGKRFARVIVFPWAEGRNVFARTMRGPWEALCSLHWLSMGIGGRVPPLLEARYASADAFRSSLHGS